MHLMGMSIHHSHSVNSDETPVSLPLATITVDPYGVLNVTLDGAEYPPPSPTAQRTFSPLRPRSPKACPKHSPAPRTSRREPVSWLSRYPHSPMALRGSPKGWQCYWPSMTNSTTSSARPCFHSWPLVPMG